MARARKNADPVIAGPPATMESKSLIGSSAFRAGISWITQRFAMATRAGLTYGGNRDIYKVFGYSRILRFSDFFSRYTRGGIARRVVDAKPRATWRNAPALIEDEDPNTDTNFETHFEEIVRATRLFHYLERADRLSGIGRYGILLIGAPGKLSDPLPRGGKILYLSAFTEYSAPIYQIESDPTSPRYGMPSYYNIGFGLDMLGANLPGAPSIQSARIVHWSRVIHIAEDLMEDEVYGTPRMLPIWNYLDDLDKILGASAEAFWRIVDRGLQFDIDKDMQAPAAGSDEEKQLTEEIELYVNQFQRYIRTQGVSVHNLGSDAPSPEQAFKAAIAMIAGGTGIPQRVLLGSEAGQLASQQDLANWNELVSQRQLQFAEPCILRPLVDRFIDFNYLPEPEAPYRCKWPDVFTLSDTDRALNAMRVAAAVLQFTQALQLGSSPVSGAEFRSLTLGYPAKMAEEPNDELNQKKIVKKKEKAASDALKAKSAGNAPNNGGTQSGGDAKPSPKTNPQTKPASGKGKEVMA